MGVTAATAVPVGTTSPRRAFGPDAVGVVSRGGVDLAYEVFGDGPVTVLLLPTWSIVPSRFWKAQVATLARRYRVVTFDGRGSGRSGRPTGASAYAPSEFAADAVAVLDATGTDRAVLVGFSCGALWGVQVASAHPERTLALVALAPAVPLAPMSAERTAAAQAFDTPVEDPEGWFTFNAPYWQRGGYTDFLRFFFGRMFTEPHCTRQVEDAVGWGQEIDPATLADTTRGLGLLDRREFRAAARRITAPVLVVHGDADEIRPYTQGAALAEATGGRLVSLEGAGHGLPMRYPVLVTGLIEDVVEQVCPTREPVRWQRPLRRPRRALFVSSPIGLGHTRRDVAIAVELRRRHPGLRVDWLAQHPVTTVLAERGEHVHPASAWLLSESAHVESECGEHDLNAFQAVRRMDETLAANFMVFRDVVAGGDYDLVVADEAWDVDHFLHENPGLKRFSYAWLTDFVGWLPLPEGGEEETALTADHNAEMLEQRARFRRLRDASVFVGNPEDVVPASFGPGLPGIAEWTRENFAFAGYVTGGGSTSGDGDGGGDGVAAARLRADLGAAEGERLCVVTVGGSGVGAPLLRRVLDASRVLRRRAPDLHVAVVAGPRIDPESLPRLDGVTVRGYLPRLDRYLAAADVAVVQGGLTTCMELAAATRPFVYVPLRRHFEQQIHVRHRLERYRAGHCLDYAEASDPDALAGAVLRAAAAPVTALPVETDGAARAAELLASLL